jgi:hypothetical protein
VARCADISADFGFSPLRLLFVLRLLLLLRDAPSLPREAATGEASKNAVARLGSERRDFGREFGLTCAMSAGHGFQHDD